MKSLSVKQQMALNLALRGHTPTQIAQVMNSERSIIASMLRTVKLKGYPVPSFARRKIAP